MQPEAVGNCGSAIGPVSKVVQPMAFIVHEHCNSTSAIDKYWLFADAVSARSFFNKFVQNWKEFLNLEHYQELEDESENKAGVPQLSCDDVLRRILSNSSMDVYVSLTDDDYLVLASADSDGFARRP
jgi:hypothetical protein